MEKKSIKKMKLNRETLRRLNDESLGRIAAGMVLCPTLDCTKPEYNCTTSCDPPCA
ncbi:MAG: hypothetical protein QOF89_1259 [Acidobacteriota bacterium]|jgi:hypothetical protein|nr:hypothetical protein [Acidobacteriota bacterium]